MSDERVEAREASSDFFFSLSVKVKYKCFYHQSLCVDVCTLEPFVASLSKNNHVKKKKKESVDQKGLMICK